MDISEGLNAVYKPVGKSSYDIIRDLKKQFPGKKIGHGGTLDPLAEGVLVIAIGRDATKQLQTVLKGTNKEYVAEITLGKISETDDREGPIKDYTPARKEHPTHEEVQEILKSFEGSIMQTPPRYSAIKIDGVPAYKRARRGEEFDMEPRPATIHEIELLEYAYPILKIRVVTGSGVYIRSLARDIGKKLKTGGYLSALLRTRVGDFDLDEDQHD